MDLIKEAEGLMLHQFRHSLKLNGLVRGLVSPLQEVMDHLEKLHHGRYIDEAKGEILDTIGAIVDFPREGRSDSEYRVWLKVAVLLNIGQGTAQDAHKILEVLYGGSVPVELSEEPPNVVEFSFFQYPKAPIKTLFAILRRAAPLSTECLFVDATSLRKKPGKATVKAMGEDEHWPIFRFDKTGWDDSTFADYFKEE